MKIAIITGVTGQDGSYLSEFLLEQKYQVHGLLRRCSHVPTERIEHLMKHPHYHLHYCDLTDAQNVYSVLTTIYTQERDTIPDEIYNLAAQSHVQVSFQLPQYTAATNALGTLNVLNAIKDLGWTTKTRFYQASTSELFGLSPPPQSETTPFHPRSPYAIAKLFAYWSTIHYREAHGMFAVNGILFNHESPRRNLSFVTRKITRAVGEYKETGKCNLVLGNLDAKRDWGHAKDYVKAMWQMLQLSTPIDLVIGTGETHTVREFVIEAFKCIGVNIIFKGCGLNEVGFVGNNNEMDDDHNNDEIIISVHQRYFRPTEVENLQANPQRARELLGWNPQYNFKELVQDMVKHDLHKINHIY